MAKCLYCDQDIKYLVNHCHVNITEKYTYDMDIGCLCRENVFSDQDAVLSFKCPKCGAVLFHSPDKVKEFLKNG